MIWQTEWSLVVFSNRGFLLPCGGSKTHSNAVEFKKIWNVSPVLVFCFFLAFFFSLSIKQRLAYHSPAPQNTSGCESVGENIKRFLQIPEKPSVIFQTYAFPSKAKIAARLEGQVIYDTRQKTKKEKGKEKKAEVKDSCWLQWALDEKGPAELIISSRQIHTFRPSSQLLFLLQSLYVVGLTAKISA